MKKYALLLTLVLAFSMFAFADGGVPVGGRTCPPDEPDCNGLIADQTGDAKQPPIHVMIFREAARLFRIFI